MAKINKWSLAIAEDFKDFNPLDDQVLGHFKRIEWDEIDGVQILK